MSNGTNTAVALGLGAGGGLLLWYLLRDKHDPHAKTPSTTAPSATTATNAVAVPATAAACALRLDPSGLIADGVKVSVTDAVARCKAARRADVTIMKDAPAATYGDLMIALGRGGVPAYGHRNAGGRRAGPRTADDVDLEEFAETVQILADKIDRDPTPEGLARGRVGERKVFIAPIRRALRRTAYADLAREVVDELLLEAHRAGYLELARADLVSIMDPAEVQDSEVVHPRIGSRFHFVISERPRNDSPASETFTLAVYPRGDEGGKRVRYYRADPPTTWEDTRDRLADAGVIDRSLFRRTRQPGGWVMTTHPRIFRADLAEPLPGGVERNATTYRGFTVRAYPQGSRKGGATLRWFRAEPPTTWAEARERLIAAGVIDPTVAGRTHEPGGWMLSVDPHDYRDERAELLPEGDHGA